eukprot:TRINITY_DN31552_c0_g1_i1.p1 TRINITY_DN31552_c0_g1~~TRINITY_DN31552_c0_g1_i1.p1  ORF type:complete len:270 (+),score=20.38 TRINITY_DN31552_c0_g1_i1:51-860(+)
MDRITVLGSHLRGVPKRILLFRHAEREDHIRPEWAVHSVRPHDPPLSAQGFQQCRELAEKIKEFVPTDEEPVVYSSPLIRTVQTANGVLDTLYLGREKKPMIKVEGLLSERGRNVRRRMMGLHPTSPDRFRKVCHPIILEKSDLMCISPSIDLAYEAQYTNRYCQDGHEINSAGRVTTLDERIISNLHYLIYRPEHHNKTIVLVSHGGVSRRIMENLTGTVLSYRPGYTHLHVLEPKPGSAPLADGSWSLISSWHPASVVIKAIGKSKE